MSPRGQEIDVWWGSFSPRTLLPSLVLGTAWSAFVVCATWLTLEQPRDQRVMFTLVVIFWLVQIVRWSMWIFGSNYRLTNRRLFMDRGTFFRRRREVELCRVARVFVKRHPLERSLGVGRVFLAIEGERRKIVVLSGVNQPEKIADVIRGCCEQARDHVGQEANR